MKNFRTELHAIFANAEWSDNEKFEAIDELHEACSHAESAADTEDVNVHLQACDTLQFLQACLRD